MPEWPLIKKAGSRCTGWNWEKRERAVLCMSPARLGMAEETLETAWKAAYGSGERNKRSLPDLVDNVLDHRRWRAAQPG